MKEKLAPARGISRRGKAVLHELQLHYQAETAEVLLSDLGSMVKQSAVARLLAERVDPNPRRRRQQAEKLMTLNVVTGEKLSPGEVFRMRQAVKPGAKTPMRDRSGIVDTLSAILKPEKAVKKDSPQAWHHIMGILGDFYPVDYGPLDSTSPHRVHIGPARLPAPVLPFGTLDMMVEQVICRDKTGEVGKDEIAISGIKLQGPVVDPAVTTPPTTVASEVLPVTFVAQFKRNDVHTYAPPRLHASFNLSSAFAPHFVAVFFGMAEQDGGGGFAGAMRDMNTELGNDIGLVLLNVFAVFISIGALGVGGAMVGSVGGVPGVVVGAIIGSVLGTIIGIWTFTSNIQNLDDIIGMSDHPTLFLVPETFTDWPFYGGTRSVSQTMVLEGSGAQYDVIYHWQLSQPQSGFVPTN